MATKVEISSALASLTAVPDLKEIRNEDKSQRVYMSVLSDASNKAKEPSASRVPEENNKFTSTLRSATMPTLASRPRLFPKPFSKEKSSDTFANVKPPVTAFKPSNPVRKATEETSPVKALSGNVPPLVEHKVIESENKASSEVVPNMTFYTGPSANTVILFETAGTEQSKVSLAQGKRAAEDHRVFGTVQAKELQFNATLEKPPQPSELSRRAEGSVHRQVSLSSHPRPVSWNSLKTRDKKDAYEDATGEKSSDDANNGNSKSGFSDVQQRLKPRPVSAAFLELLREQKHQSVEPAEEKSPTEKSWARKPRPLSMDLTAKFEHKDPSPCKKTCSSHESKENVSLTHITDVSCRGQPEMGPKNEDKEFNKDSSPKANLKRSSHDIGVLNDGKYLWETQHKCKSEQSETKPEGVAPSRASERCSDASSDSRTSQEARRADLKETCVLLTRDSPAAASDKENSIKRGSVKKHISLFASENPTVPMDTEPLPSPAERENGYVNIQQRIKELTTEGTEAKPGHLRRSPQSRPLSADLTKMFSSPTSSSEVKPEKLADVRTDSTNEMHEKNKEPKLPHGTDLSEACTVGNAWKARQILKLTNKADQAEGKGNFLGDGQQFPLQSENSVSFTSSFEKKLKPAPVMEKTYVKTVRATMFDHNVERHNVERHNVERHNVERHNVAAAHSGVDPALRVNNELDRKPELVAPGQNKGSQVGEAAEETTSTKQYHKQSHSSKHIADVEKSASPACTNEGKKTAQTILLEKRAVEKSEKHSPANVEDSVTHQRVEPRYEIFQTFGERVLSEAITMAPEKKAVTLRTRKSSVKEQKNDGDVLHPEQPARLNNKTDYVKEASITSDTKDTKAFPSRFTFKEPNDFSLSGCALPAQKKDPGKHETAPILIAEKIHYSTDKSKSLGINEQANKLHSEVKNEESEVPSAERPNVMKYPFEKRSVRSGRADGHEFRTNFGHEVILTSVNKHGAQSSSALSSGQVCKSPSSHHPDMEVQSTSKEKPRAFDLRKCLDSKSVEQSFSLDRKAHESREKFRVTEPEEKIRRTKSSIADLKISDRWRRKTLPQDSIRTEDVGLLTPESIKRLNRTEFLQLEEGSVKKRSKKSKEGTEGDEPNQTADDYLKNQSSAFEPKATYFAVTYQVPGDKKEKSFGTPSASETCKISPSSEVLTTNLDPIFSKKSKPVLQPPNKNITHANCREDSRDVYVNKDWVKEEEKNEANSSKSIAVTNFQVAGKDNQKYHERSQDCSKDKTIDVDAFLLKQDLENTPQTDLRSSGRKVSPYYEHRSSQLFAQLHKSSELVSQKSSESQFDIAAGKAEHGYRSRILDIDALMAEYKEESVIQDKPSEDHSLFNKEFPKNKRNVSDWTSSYSWKERKGLDHCFAKNKQGDSAEDYNRPEKLILNEKNSEKLESFGSEFDKQKSKDRKFSPPYWGSPSSLFSDKLVNSPVEFTRKKTFIIDEDQETNLISRQQSSTFANDKLQPASVVGTGQKLEINLASKLSVKADVGQLQKKLVTKEQFLEVASESDWSKDVTRSYISKSRDDASKTSRDSDSSNVKSKTDWKSYTSTWGSAPPDLRRSYSEKSRQGKDNVPLMKEARGRKDLYRFRQSFPPESVENGWKKKMSSQSESFFHEDKKASGKVWTKQTSEKADGTDFTLVSLQRRSQSFYKDRRTDSWTDQLKQCFSRQPPEPKDTDTLVREPDSRYGTWGEQRRSGASFAGESPSSENNVTSSRKQPPSSQPSSLSSQTEPASLLDRHDSARDQRSTSLDRSSTDMDSMDGTDLPPPGDSYPEEKTTDFSFIDQTTVLDSSALKTRAQLSKKRRHRAPLSHSLRRSRGSEFENRFSLEDPDSSWMFKDSTEEKKTMQQEDSDEEEKTHRIGKSSSVQAQRLPVFPGMDHAVLKAQLRKRQESETCGEISSAQQLKSPKAPGAAGSRALPGGADREDRSEEKSPQWLKELKSKKRQSHYENQV
ncbi:PREDICTED: uncharacterized protein KIAA1671 homolog [Tinamus guttatus]|uniref:uncharacterized protein KIAA1671 homolog n=1 Tax=Tinamus guttatus TaxID=94827 RepID=UPI00052E9A17|nr:PREDICTED: uncharacterized protein KIAA1671 homolog [Tinamus guttatus]